VVQGAPASAPQEPVRRVVAAAASGEAVPVTALTDQTVASGKSDALPRAAQAFAPESSLASTPALRNIPAETDPPLQLPATAPLPRPRPKL
jgi:hypothetical protein